MFSSALACSTWGDKLVDASGKELLDKSDSTEKIGSTLAVVELVQPMNINPAKPEPITLSKAGQSNFQLFHISIALLR
ncbi:hypothetical protein H6F75_15325 [Nodosilinea sp. FACHB-131]|uniref:hypothetical protein n=1 Tax=Cyanophyceae TaxID=3028117 RepID=UPI001684E38F|nr:hypothetical protein [Nodosilinea sp. FACHB-131]MBD1874857.1 hypothetical protein [Nodosilinea sp. FACHB-131]